MSKKICELCSNPARMFCESDQASLCWDCDEKVHAANFLVAKHCRTLLCHVCTSPTPWKAAGPKLGPTVSICQACVENENESVDEDSQESESDDGEYYDDSDYYSEEEEDEEEEKEGENQVVPWSSCSDAPPQSPAREEISSSGVSFSSLKRTREDQFEYETEEGGCSSQDSDPKIDAYGLHFRESDTYVSSPLSLSRPLKLQRTNEDRESMLSDQSPSGRNPVNSAIVDKLRRIQRENVAKSGDASAVILDIYKLTRDP